MAIIDGDAGNNVLNGTDDPDIIDGKQGNDTLSGARARTRCSAGTATTG
jgi:Ca2+-binding RTX toxin-like protein